jgi:hypothetical protein
MSDAPFPAAWLKDIGRSCSLNIVIKNLISTEAVLGASSIDQLSELLSSPAPMVVEEGKCIT